MSCQLLSLSVCVVRSMCVVGPAILNCDGEGRASALGVQASSAATFMKAWEG